MSKNIQLEKIFEQVRIEKDIEKEQQTAWKQASIRRLDFICEMLTRGGWIVDKDYSSGRLDLIINIGKYKAIVAIFWQSSELAYLPPNSGAIEDRKWQMGGIDDVEDVETKLLENALTIERVYGIN
jgi:hypothetical protein